MGGPAYHGWTHRPAADGGTDPIPGGGYGEWIRLGVSTDYTIPAGTRHQIDWDVEANPHPDIFTVSTLSGAPAIRIDKDGTYIATFGLYVDVATPTFPTNSNVWVNLQNVPWSTEEENLVFDISSLLSYSLASPILSGSKAFRKKGADQDKVQMCVTTLSAADDDLVVIGGDLNITYFEIMRVAGAANVGDPNDFV